MSHSHLVRVGVQGQIGRYAAGDGTLFPRGTRVIVRTGRGLEVGEVLSPPGPLEDEAPSAGPLLRGMTVEDELLQARLDRHRDAAYAACADHLEQRQPAVTLMDVEHLFDGRSVVFYFLGPEPPELERLTGELAEVYDAKSQFRAFAEMLSQGCGPGCGTEHAEGPGCGHCATGCAIAGACGTSRRATAPGPAAV